MARTASKARRPRARPQVDWVVNGDTYGAQYSGLAANSILTLPLTYSDSFRTADLGDLGAGPVAITQWTAYTEGSKQKTLAVRGDIGITPSAWTAGTAIRLMFRIVPLPMDVTTGGAVVETIYSLDNYISANEEYCWQYLVYDSFTAGTATQTKVRVNASARRTLKDNEALYLVVDNLPGSSTLSIHTFLRTLCQAAAR